MTQAIKSIWRENSVPLMMMLGFAIGMATGWADLKSDQRHILDRITTIEQRGSPQVDSLNYKLGINQTEIKTLSKNVNDLSKKMEDLVLELKQHEITTVPNRR